MKRMIHSGFQRKSQVASSLLVCYLSARTSNSMIYIVVFAVEPKNMLDDTVCKDSFTQFVKAPANLVVLEGDCLDVTGDAGELESYLVC